MKKRNIKTLLCAICLIGLFHGVSVANTDVAKAKKKATVTNEEIETLAKAEKSVKTEETDVEESTKVEDEDNSWTKLSDEELVQALKEESKAPFEQLLDVSLVRYHMPGVVLPDGYTSEPKTQDKLEKTIRRGQFTTYKYKGGSYTVYNGPSLDTQEAIGSKYPWPTNTLVQTHITANPEGYTQHVEIGDQRGVVILRYGAPRAIWQTPDSLIYWYNVPYTLGGQKSNIYVAYTMKDLKVTSIDGFEPGLKMLGTWPNLEMNKSFQAGQLENRDFSLLGYKLQETYTPAKGIDREWDKQGKIWQQNYVDMDNVIVVYDDNNRISTVILKPGNSVTKRGIGVGSNKILMLKTYGLPSKKIEDFAIQTNEGQLIYEYKNPYAPSQYLLFAVNKKDYFVDAVILSTRSAEQYYKFDDAKQAKFLIYGKSS